MVERPLAPRCGDEAGHATVPAYGRVPAESERLRREVGRDRVRGGAASARDPSACNKLLHHAYAFSGDCGQAGAYTDCIKEIEAMKTIKVMFLVSMLAVLSGCMVVPVAPGPPAYYAPAYVGPSIGVGIYGGGWGYGGGHGGGYGGGYGRGWGHH